ncbi:agmatinase [Schizosaccharomyces cryophilus OY26]|uniref:Agmatinase n=1 Tax=Schizosaccharomyces cryophilus (strain OY26 / ATCC MYA-4695 / CBS 11777 / NBRC 106824 / NRRL Y48691) TaxID=653667 RepID=S9X816_SCHCR|nr:agmatinase [Schizosaccharomyces cryophilus OY26]EPY53282.1 agmatinase [Schizosaccharomyces cryophilus OY26]
MNKMLATMKAFVYAVTLSFSVVNAGWLADTKEQKPFYSLADEYQNFDDEYIPKVHTLYSGVSTFGHLPYTECLKSRGIDYDIAFVGAPFDMGTSYRPGARFGPSGIREGSRRLAPSLYHVPLDVYPFQSWAKVVDCGDIPMTNYHIPNAMQELEEGYYHLLARKPASFTNDEGYARNETVLPRLLTMGGDHTIVLPILRALSRAYDKPISVIHFDSHLDTWKPGILGDGIDNNGLNHGTYFYWASKEGVMSKDANIHAGIRCPLSGLQDYEDDVSCGFEVIEAREIDKIGVEGVIKKIRDRVQDNLVYLSIDIDTLDPAYAPATGTPEIAGWSTREFVDIIRGLDGLKFVGADIVEVSPAYDVADLTTMAAANIFLDIVSMLVRTPLIASKKTLF